MFNPSTIDGHRKKEEGQPSYHPSTEMRSKIKKLYEHMQKIRSISTKRTKNYGGIRAKVKVLEMEEHQVLLRTEIIDDVLEYFRKRSLTIGQEEANRIVNQELDHFISLDPSRVHHPPPKRSMRRTWERRKKKKKKKKKHRRKL